MDGYLNLISRRNEIDNRVSRFRTIAQERWLYLENGDSKKGNKCFDELSDISKELRNEDKLTELVVLLDDLDDGVKFEAASELLTINQAKAEETLDYLASKKGVLPFTARQTLKQWKTGNLKF